MTLYQRIKEIAAPIVKHYQTDLTKHDRRVIAAMEPGESVMWVARECGTHMIHFRHRVDSVSAQTLEHMRDRLNYFDAVTNVFGYENGVDHWYLVECVDKRWHGNVTHYTAGQARDIFVHRIKSLEQEIERQAA